jgi:GTP cyclohydrolase II
LLGGNPHAIILAAPILMKMKLKELYLMLNSKEMHEMLKVDGITDSSVASLRVSLEASIIILERDDKDAL